MEANLTELVWKAASTVVTLLATEAWEKSKRALGALWRRVCPDKADAPETEPAQTRDKILAARIQGDVMAGESAITMRARSSGNGRVYQAGRDQHIHQS